MPAGLGLAAATTPRVIEQADTRGAECLGCEGRAPRAGGFIADRSILVGADDLAAVAGRKGLIDGQRGDDRVEIARRLW